jgi:hypothetical protein
VRSLFDEMSTLSAKATRWVLPSYLRIAVASSSPGDPFVEFLVYNLGPRTEDRADTMNRLSLLNQDQITCLVTVLQHWNEDPRWAYHTSDIDRAIAFLMELRR